MKFLFVVIVYILILSFVSAFSYGVINIRLAQICRHVFAGDVGAYISHASLYVTDIVIFCFMVFCGGLVYWLSLKQVRLGLIGYTLFEMYIFLSMSSSIKNLCILIPACLIVLVILLCISKWLFQTGRGVRGRLLPQKSQIRG